MDDAFFGRARPVTITFVAHADHCRGVTSGGQCHVAGASDRLTAGDELSVGGRFHVAVPLTRDGEPRGGWSVVKAAREISQEACWTGGVA